MRIRVGGKSHTVSNREEELALLRRLTEEANDQAAIAKGLGDEVLARRIIKKVQRLEKKVDERAAWLQRLLRDDEEILLLLSA
jgi:phage shock protein A